MTEREIQSAILKEIGAIPGIRIWRANCGVGRGMDSDRVTRFGIPGQCDVTGIVADGRRLEIEVKTQTGRLSERQKFFAAMITKQNGIYILARSVKDVYEGLVAAGIDLRAAKAGAA